MPTPSKGESRSEFMKRCVPMVMGEGLDQEAAVGKCEGMFDSHLKDQAGAEETNKSELPPFLGTSFS